MDEDALILKIRARAADPTTRTDYAQTETPELGQPAPLGELERAERALGCTLHPLHRRLLREIGNGGFGPGDGLIGVANGRLDAEGRSIVELCDQLLLTEDGGSVAAGVVPLCDWGDGAWSCVDESSGIVLTLDENGLTDTGMTLHSWLEKWVSGESLVEKLFEIEERSGINPFTKQPMTARLRGRPLGAPYIVRR